MGIHLQPNPGRYRIATVLAGVLGEVRSSRSVNKDLTSVYTDLTSVRTDLTILYTEVSSVRTDLTIVYTDVTSVRTDLARNDAVRHLAGGRLTSTSSLRSEHSGSKTVESSPAAVPPPSLVSGVKAGRISFARLHRICDTLAVR